jgi:4-hydroxy-2-oxoheptanedioate aldolase
MGLPGRVEHPQVLGAISTLVMKCKSKNKCVGIFVDNQDAAKRYLHLGVQFIAYSVDVGIFSQACVAALGSLKKKSSFLRKGSATAGSQSDWF